MRPDDELLQPSAFDTFSDIEGDTDDSYLERRRSRFLTHFWSDRQARIASGRPEHAPSRSVGQLFARYTRRRPLFVMFAFENNNRYLTLTPTGQRAVSNNEWLLLHFWRQGSEVVYKGHWTRNYRPRLRLVLSKRALQRFEKVGGRALTPNEWGDAAEYIFKDKPVLYRFWWHGKKALRKYEWTQLRNTLVKAEAGWTLSLTPELMEKVRMSERGSAVFTKSELKEIDAALERGWDDLFTPQERTKLLRRGGKALTEREWGDYWTTLSYAHAQNPLQGKKRTPRRERLWLVYKCDLCGREARVPQVWHIMFGLAGFQTPPRCDRDRYLFETDTESAQPYLARYLTRFDRVESHQNALYTDLDLESERSRMVNMLWQKTHENLKYERPGRLLTPEELNLRPDPHSPANESPWRFTTPIPGRRWRTPAQVKAYLLRKQLRAEPPRIGPGILSIEWAGKTAEQIAARHKRAEKRLAQPSESWREKSAKRLEGVYNREFKRLLRQPFGLPSALVALQQVPSTA